MWSWHHARFYIHWSSTQNQNVPSVITTLHHQQNGIWMLLSLRTINRIYSIKMSLNLSEQVIQPITSYRFLWALTSLYTVDFLVLYNGMCKCVRKRRNRKVASFLSYMIKLRVWCSLILIIESLNIPTHSMVIYISSPSCVQLRYRIKHRHEHA